MVGACLLAAVSPGWDARLSPHSLTSSQPPATTIFGFSPTHTNIQRMSIGYDTGTLSKS